MPGASEAPEWAKQALVRGYTGVRQSCFATIRDTLLLVLLGLFGLVGLTDSLRTDAHDRTHPHQ